MKYLLTIVFLYSCTICFAQTVKQSPIKKTCDSVYTAPQPDSGWAYFESKLHYPSMTKQAKREGLVWLKIAFDSTGKIDSITSKYTIWEELEGETEYIVRHITWQPARLNGKPVRCNFDLTVFYGLRDTIPAKHLIFEVEPPPPLLRTDYPWDPLPVINKK
jgi:hypothetical protein